MPEAAAKGREAQRSGADRFAANVLPVIESIKAAGATSFDAIAQALNARGVRTARGGRWHSTTVRKPTRPQPTGMLKGHDGRDGAAKRARGADRSAGGECSVILMPK
jgi:recombinase